MDLLRTLFGKPRDTPPDELRHLHEAVLQIDPSARIEDGHVLLENGMRLRTECIDRQAFPNGGVRTSTTTVALHPQAFPDGLLEYQHASGENEEAALRSGFDTWVRMDLNTLLGALEAEPERCSYMEMTFPEDEAHGERTRQIVFGPTGRYGTAPAAEDECHPFCPCCLFTNSMQAFMPPLGSTDFLGVRLFASRDGEGGFSADCRINGEDYPEALPLLIEYAQSWPGDGLEFRKQYIVIRNKP